MYAGDFVTKLTGPQYSAGLFAGPSGDNLSLLATTPFLSGASAGLFSGGIVTIPGVPTGGTAWVKVVAWDTTLGGITDGASFSQAQASGGPFWGESLIFSVVTAGPLPQVPADLVGLTSFEVPACLTFSFQGIFTPPANQTVALGDTATFFVQAAACPAPWYQWYRDGVALPGATRSICQITNAQPKDAGNYYVTLTNPAWGAHTSATATLTVLAEPIVTSQPESQTAYVGTTAKFQVGAWGAPPLAYQWFFNAGSITSASDFTLSLTNLQLSHSGNYAVVVTNAYGAVTSAPGTLSVVSSVERTWAPGLILVGQPGITLNLETADALAPSPNWSTLDRVLLTNAAQWYFDLSAPLPNWRYYRAWQSGQPITVPKLDSHLLPTLTLTGAVGGTIRVDAINRLGPTDAWFPLATLTLTNTSQLFFDTTAPGTPTRLYRLVPLP